MSHKYEISDKDLSEIISRALDKIKLPDYESNQELHKKLSQIWVKQLASEIEKHYKIDNPDIVSFFNQRETAGSPIKFKEFLFDITVAETKHIKNSQLSFISNPIWQIESEFQQHLSAIIDDFQKLISGCAPFKIMVGPLSTRNKKNGKNKYLEITKELAACVSGTLYFLFITHPHTWFKKGKRTKYADNWLLYKWDESEWISLL